MFHIFSRGVKSLESFFLNGFDQVLERFVAKQEEMLGVCEIWSEWKSKVLGFTKLKIQWTLSALAMMVPWFLFSYVDSKHLKGLKKKILVVLFFITYMNKSLVFNEINPLEGHYLQSSLLKSEVLNLLILSML